MSMCNVEYRNQQNGQEGRDDASPFSCNPELFDVGTKTRENCYGKKDPCNPKNNTGQEYVCGIITINEKMEKHRTKGQNKNYSPDFIDGVYCK